MDAITNEIASGKREFLESFNSFLNSIRLTDLQGFLNVALGFYIFFERLKEKDEVYREVFDKIPDFAHVEFLKTLVDKSIEENGEKGTVETVASYLKYPQIKEIVYRMLNIMDRDTVIKGLIKLYEDTDDNILSERIFQYLLDNASSVIPYIDEFLNSRDMVLVVKALRILKRGKPEECVPKIGELLEHTNPVIQKEALRVLIEIGRDECVEMIKSRFFNLMGEEQIEALNFLKDMGEIEFIKQVSEMPGLQMNTELFNAVNKILEENR